MIGKCLVNGTAAAPLLYSPVSLSFWGGVNPQSGEIVDCHHPLRGESIAHRILAIPCSRGSCSGSTVMLELLLNGCAPAGLIVEQPEEILTLGVLVAQVLFHRSLPVIILSHNFHHLSGYTYASIDEGQVSLSETPLSVPQSPPCLSSRSRIDLSPSDQAILAGEKGPAAKMALEIVVEFAAMQGAPALIDVTRAHVDACIYTGPASLRFAQTFQSLGARFVLPTTLNAISIDQRRWRELGVDPDLAAQAGTLANIYLAMGAQPSFTCAPYTLDDAVPVVGENIGWAESNAVVYANSVLGAHTQKYPDFVDVCIALTGRAPSAGCHTVDGRRPAVAIHLPLVEAIDDAIFAVLGYLVGKHAQHRVPWITGMQHLQPRRMHLKAFSAAFGTTASAAMYHMDGVTPEADQFAEDASHLPRIDLQPAEIAHCRCALTSATDPSVGLVSLGNPHFSLEEFEALRPLCIGRRKNPAVEFVITTSRSTYEAAATVGIVDVLEEFGAVIITDTCWCMLGEPVVPPGVRNLMTNSAKYAHYAPGMVHRGVHFGSLAECVEVSVLGHRSA
ncbi:hypothetical protein EYZ11_003874 [Aspergillus tanneri]|uniref:Aconitase X catalytic domain-containing protein n=1 Tax=Aspergillus tanneri TaxID=1220188 RepID=A0A4S3JM16_9EURO|nr:uncharacterized protein ATNIH1004_005851 [Aspergillus tanneri]KAA8647163.1 hypothetical protein ATNIH1004_005851 [Aspergillus tanneri]THC96669.1 hypothetical protein EYZ11_003874 [Aspergillus tanneri]